MPAASSLTRFETLEFIAELDGRPEHCLITITALKSRFNATDETAGRVLLENLDKVRSVAVEIARHSAPGERIVLRSTDFARAD